MNRPISILLLTVGAMLLTGSATVANGPPPEGRTYFIYLMGLEDDLYDISADCLEFDETQACSIGDQFCMTWQEAEGGSPTSKAFGISFAAEIDSEGLLITLEGQGRVETRGRRSSISGVGRAAALDVQVNFAFSGREVGRSKCLRMVEDFFEQ